MSFVQRSFTHALFLASAALGARGAEAACTVKGERSEWRPVVLARPAPEGVAVEWRWSYGRAFNECLNEVTVRMRNTGAARVTVDLGRCAIDGAGRAGPRLTASPGKTARAMLDMVKAPSVASVTCEGAAERAAVKGNPAACANYDSTIRDAKGTLGRTTPWPQGRNVEAQYELCLAVERALDALVNVSGAHCPERLAELRSTQRALGARKCSEQTKARLRGCGGRATSYGWRDAQGRWRVSLCGADGPPRG